MTDEESRKNWEEYGNPDGPEGEAIVTWFCVSLFAVYDITYSAKFFAGAIVQRMCLASGNQLQNKGEVCTTGNMGEL